MSDAWKPQLAVALLLVGVAGAALWRGVQRNRELPIRVVESNVGSIRASILGLEKGARRAPVACGDEREALAAADGGLEGWGRCGVHYYGKEYSQPGAYWVEVSPGGMDFTVWGLVSTPDGMVRVRASRTETPRIVE